MVLIPLNQGLFLNVRGSTITNRRHGLNPFESGSVFKPVGCWIFFSYQFSAKQLSNFFLVAKAVSFFHSCRIFYLLPTRLCYASCRRRQCAMSCPTVFSSLSLRGLQAGDAGMTGSDCPCARPNDFEFASHRMCTCRRRRWWRQWLKYGCVFHS